MGARDEDPEKQGKSRDGGRREASDDDALAETQQAPAARGDAGDDAGDDAPEGARGERVISIRLLHRIKIDIK